jgi:hypothetical protein
VAGTLSTAYLVAGAKDAVLIDTCTGQAGLKDVVDGLIGNKRLLVALTTATATTAAASGTSRKCSCTRPTPGCSRRTPPRYAGT